MRRTIPSLLFPVATLLVMLVLGKDAKLMAQQEAIDQAFTAARSTGAPILVIAGRETCPNCQNLIDQLGRQEFARLTSSMIPLKIDVDQPQFQEWARKFGRPDGNTLPFVYIVRADGQTLHSHSGPMDSAQLANVIAAQLQTAGRPLNPRQLETIDQAVAAAREQMEAGNPSQAVRELMPLKQIGELGQIGSYSAAAVQADQFVAELKQDVVDRLGNVTERVESQDDALQACFDVVQAKRIYGSIPAIDSIVNPMLLELRRNRELRETMTEAQAIDRACRQCEGPQTREQGLEALQRMIDESPGSPAATLAQELIDQYTQQ